METSYSTWYSQWTSVVFLYQLPAVVSDAPLGGSGGAPQFALELQPSAPNPVAQSASIRFALPAAGNVVLELLDVRGRRLQTVLEGMRPAGAHEVTWSRGRLPDGVYLFRLRAGDRTTSRKLVLVR